MGTLDESLELRLFAFSNDGLLVGNFLDKFIDVGPRCESKGTLMIN